MFGLFRRSRPSATFTAQEVQFLGEQHGPPETALKEDLRPILRQRARVSRVYLARVRYQKSGANDVALCVAGSDVDEGLVADVAAIFARRFGADMHLDILFLTAGQERELAGVCQPFYVAAAV